MSKRKKVFSGTDVVTTDLMNQFVQETQIKSALSTDTEPEGYKEIPSLKLVSDKFASVLEADGETAKKATSDGNSNNIVNTYATKSNPTFTGAVKVNDENSVITSGSVTPNGNNIGLEGLILTHTSWDEGGLVISADGAYLWNSTDNQSLLRGIDEDKWPTSEKAIQDCNFTDGLLFDFDMAGNLKIKGKFYQDNGAELVVNATNIQIQNGSAFGNATNLQEVLNYIDGVFKGK